MLDGSCQNMTQTSDWTPGAGTQPDLGTQVEAIYLCNQAPPLPNLIKGWPLQKNVLYLEITSFGVFDEPWSSKRGK